MKGGIQGRAVWKRQASLGRGWKLLSRVQESGPEVPCHLASGEEGALQAAGSPGGGVEWLQKPAPSFSGIKTYTPSLSKLEGCISNMPGSSVLASGLFRRFPQ